MAEARADGSTAKTNFDAAGNPTRSSSASSPSGQPERRCELSPSGSTRTACRRRTARRTGRCRRFRARSARRPDGWLAEASGATTTYDPDHNYAIKAFFVPTGSGREHQTLYDYDERHRLETITHQLCDLDTGTQAAHDCSSTTATGSDSYLYDDNDNRTKVAEDNGATGSDRRFCYDAQNRLIYRNTGAACSGTAKDEAYTYDDAGNRLSALVGGSTTSFAYNTAGHLCKVGATVCGSTPNVSYDSAGRTASYGGWVYEYDAEGRLTRACKSTSCSGSIDRVDFAYDGEGHRTQIVETSAGGATTTIDFRYQGEAIVEESTNGSVSRGYVVDEAGRIVRFCDPSCANPTASYLVTWNGHGDALALWRIETNGSLMLANSFTYSTEDRLCHRDLWQCGVVRDTQLTAWLRSQQIHMREHTGVYRDAVRHCVWNALMAVRLGARRAEIWADTFEADSPNRWPFNQMDQWNNMVGRRIGERLRSRGWIWLGPIQRMEAFNACDDARRRGQLFVVINGRLRWSDAVGGN